jgi:hypothetical protein
VEASGVCSAAWLLALINKRIVGYQPDEVYIGNRQDRTAKEEEIDSLELGLDKSNDDDTPAKQGSEVETAEAPAKQVTEVETEDGY